MGCGSSTVSSESQAAEKPTGHPPSKQPTTDDSKTGSKSTNFGQTNEKLTSQETDSKKPCEQDNILKTEENKQNTDEFKGTPLLRAPAAPPLKQTKVDTNFVRTTSDLKDELDMDIARLFNSCDIPLEVADSHYFKATWKRARPGYTPPSRTKLADQLLPKMHTEQTQQMNSDVGNQAALVQDRDSSIHNDSNNATSSQEDRRSYFYDRTDQGLTTNNTDYCDESRFIKIFVSLVHGL